MNGKTPQIWLTRKGHSDVLRVESCMMRWSQHSKATKKSILVRGYKTCRARKNEKFCIFEKKEKTIVEGNGQV